MKNLYILRHAKSDWSEEFVDDFKRGLSKKGFRDILKVAKELKKQRVKLDLIVSSSATRAKITAEIFGAILGYDIDNINFTKELYLADTKDILNIIRNIDKKIDNLLIVGHNPELTDLVNSLTNINLDNLPTSGFVGVKFNIDTWNDIKKGKNRIYLTPKKVKRV